MRFLADRFPVVELLPSCLPHQASQEQKARLLKKTTGLDACMNKQNKNGGNMGFACVLARENNRSIQKTLRATDLGCCAQDPSSESRARISKGSRFDLAAGRCVRFSRRAYRLRGRSGSGNPHETDSECRGSFLSTLSRSRRTSPIASRKLVNEAQQRDSVQFRYRDRKSVV